jgi:hypothetical protein
MMNRRYVTVIYTYLRAPALHSEIVSGGAGDNGVRGSGSADDYEGIGGGGCIITH